MTLWLISQALLSPHDAGWFISQACLLLGATGMLLRGWQHIQNGKLKLEGERIQVGAWVEDLRLRAMEKQARMQAHVEIERHKTDRLAKILGGIALDHLIAPPEKPKFYADRRGDERRPTKSELEVAGQAGLWDQA